ncbi:hypothetical protein [Allobaculum sp. Allo2]|uniref:hypothetical protein n=1 Tax=Allobaculum sp. Allo2 TaxID=2853432 RepID=UPI001F619049|nr:hypothetical protein [Allobaculum sp. Allo2]UNT93168.1 hypothetical protein KWG61_14360 [Allobaculum sp. Allo2]
MKYMMFLPCAANFNNGTGLQKMRGKTGENKKTTSAQDTILSLIAAKGKRKNDENVMKMTR